jgi:hypothetical protein
MNPEKSPMTCLSSKRKWRNIRRSAVLERRQDVLPKSIDEGFLITINVVQIDLAHPQGAVLLQPG